MARMVWIYGESKEYAGRRLTTGEQFDCDERDVHTLEVLGWAERVADAFSEQTYETRVMTPRRRGRPRKTLQ